MAMPDTATAEVTTAAMETAKGASIVKHIVERRIEYLLGSLIAYQLGLLDQLVTYGSGMC
jgi:hypothetical protein